MTGAYLDSRVDLSTTPAATIDDVPASSAQVRDAARRLTFDEEMSYSEAKAFEPYLHERNKQLVALGMDAALADFGDTLPREVREQAQRAVETGQPIAPTSRQLIGTGGSALSRLPRAVEYYRRLDELRRANPGVFRDDSEITALVTEQLRAEREANKSVIARGSSTDAFLGSMQAGLAEPLLIATLPLGAGAGTGRTVLGSAARVFAAEAAIGAATEIPLQAEILDFKRHIQSPYTLGDAAVGVLAASLGAGAIGSVADLGARGIADLVSRYRQAGAATPEADQAARVLDEIVRRRESRPDAVATEAHSDAIDAALDQLSEGRIADVGELVPDDALEPLRARYADAETELQLELSAYIDLEPGAEVPRSEALAQAVTDARSAVEVEDIEVPVRLDADLGTGEPQLVVRSARELLDEAESRRRGVEAVRNCFLGNT